MIHYIGNDGIACDAGDAGDGGAAVTTDWLRVTCPACRAQRVAVETWEAWAASWRDDPEAALRAVREAIAPLPDADHLMDGDEMLAEYDGDDPGMGDYNGV